MRQIYNSPIGQSLHYAMMTDSKAGIILIMEHRAAAEYLEKLKALIAEYKLPIEVFQIRPCI